MKIATILFVYKRYKHTENVLEALSKNYILPEILFIFQDGPKATDNREEWQAVNRLIKEVSFCPTKVQVANSNKGLANSVVHGVNRVLQDYDAVIVLEDDCVPTPNFLNFMYQCLEHYRDNKQVYSITGYAWPLGWTEQASDVYFTGRMCSWGWATWRDRWQHYLAADNLLDGLTDNADGSKYLATWGSDLPRMYRERLTHKNDSWAVYWALNIIARRGLCMSPYKSLIDNIGCDNSGTHIGVTQRFVVALEDEPLKRYDLPDKVEIAPQTPHVFASLYGSYTAVANNNNGEPVYIYGLGEFFRTHEAILNQMYRIQGFIDRHKSGYYAGLPIIQPCDSHVFHSHKIVIMLADAEECLRVAATLQLSCAVSPKNIWLGRVKKTGAFYTVKL